MDCARSDLQLEVEGQRLGLQQSGRRAPEIPTAGTPIAQRRHEVPKEDPEVGRGTRVGNGLRLLNDELAGSGSGVDAEVQDAQRDALLVEHIDDAA